MSNIYDWSKNPDGNHDSDDLVTWREGMAPSQVNNSARAMMKRIRDNAYDRLFAREPVVGATNLRVTLEEDFEDYVDGMLVRFRCPNDIGTVPDNALLCVTNIPVDKRGNDGNGLPMVMLSWDREEKGLRVKRVTGDMFPPGAHITAIYSSIHHIWEGAAYDAEQKADMHLQGDTLPLLKTDPQWELYKNDIGVFFVYSDSNMAEIQKMIDGTVGDALYSCTHFPLFTSEDFSGEVTRIGVATPKEKECQVLVRYTDASRLILSITEDSVYNDGVVKSIPRTNLPFYSSNELCLAIMSLAGNSDNVGWVNIEEAISQGMVDRNKLNNTLLAQGKFSLANKSVVDFSLGGIIQEKSSYQQGQSFVTFFVDDMIYCTGTRLLEPRTGSLINPQFGDFTRMSNSQRILDEGEHEIKFYIFPINDGSKQTVPQMQVAGGIVINGQKYTIVGLNIQLPVM